jgi:hypothetical protein
VSYFIEAYKRLLIAQYADKEKATAHISAILSKFEEVYEFAKSFEKAFDIDFAIGKQLDIIGKIVRINRNVPFAIPKKYFGFDGHKNAYPFGDKSKDVVAYPFKDKFEIPYTSGTLNDQQYRFFIKAKIMKNYSCGKIIDEDDRLSIQNAIDYIFNGIGYITDRKNMTLTLYIDRSFDEDMIQYIKQAEVLPRPQGVKYNSIVQYDNGKTFGFYDRNGGFGDKSGDKIDSYFATKI